jgi:hypothetical protein
MVRFDGRSTLRWTRNSKTGVVERVAIPSHEKMLDEW